MSRPIETIRASFREQVQPRRGLLGYCFDSFAATLEIFLHYNIGQAYLTFVRSFVMAGMFLAFAFLFSFDVEMRSFREAINRSNYDRTYEEQEQRRLVSEEGIGVWSALIATRLSPVIPRATDDGSAMEPGPLKLARFRVFPVVCRHGGSDRLALIWPATVFVLIVSRLQMAWNFGRDRLRKGGLHNYPGEPLPLWNPVFKMLDYLNFRLNVIRVIAEPSLCVLAGIALAIALGRPGFEHPDRYLFIARWLFWGGVALGIKAYLDDHKRVAELMEVEDDAPSVTARELAQSGRQPESVTNPTEPRRVV